MLAESANLLMMPGRARDQKQWMADSKLLLEAGTAALAAVKAKDVAAISALSDQLLESCTSCHGITGPTMESRSRQVKCAALVLAAMIGGASHASAQSTGVVLHTSTEQIPLKVYAELHRSGVMQLTSGSLKDIPVIQDFRFIRSALTGWFPGRALVASDEFFKNERAERRILPIATRQVGVTAFEVRIADLESFQKIAELLSAVGVPEGSDDALLLLHADRGRDDAVLPVQVQAARAIARSAPLHPPPRRQQRRGAQQHSAQAQRDHDDVPERAVIVEERKIEAVQAVIQPAVDAASAALLFGRWRRAGDRDRARSAAGRRSARAGPVATSCRPGRSSTNRIDPSRTRPRWPRRAWPRARRRGSRRREAPVSGPLNGWSSDAMPAGARRK